MANAKAENRTRLIQAATKLTYLHGFGKTALADIAKEASVPLGECLLLLQNQRRDWRGDRRAASRAVERATAEVGGDKLPRRAAVRFRQDDGLEFRDGRPQRLSDRNLRLRSA